MLYVVPSLWYLSMHGTWKMFHTENNQVSPIILGPLIPDEQEAEEEETGVTNNNIARFLNINTRRQQQTVVLGEMNVCCWLRT